MPINDMTGFPKHLGTDADVPFNTPSSDVVIAVFKDGKLVGLSPTDRLANTSLSSGYILTERMYVRQLLGVTDDTTGIVAMFATNTNTAGSVDIGTTAGPGGPNLDWLFYGLTSANPSLVQMNVSGESEFDINCSTFFRFSNNGGTTQRMRLKNGLILGAGTVDPGAGNLAMSGGIVGANDASDAAAGKVGEFVSSLVATGSAVSMNTATALNVTSISLTAGDWDVEGNININSAGSTLSAQIGGISLSSATVPTDGTEVKANWASSGTYTCGLTIPRKRISFDNLGVNPQTVYLVAQTTYSGIAHPTAFGSITARRVR